MAGSASLFIRTSGNWSSGSARASAIDFIQSSEFSNHRARMPMGLKTFSKCLRLRIGVSSLAVASSLIAKSDNNLPGATSSSLANSFRTCHNCLTTANCDRFLILCIPDVLRHGSTRGGDGGAEMIAAKSSSAQLHLLAARKSSSTLFRSSINSSTSSAA
ncbi:unannotated protein [freshwater metagenome]|uniref:Unannotated protein n=1 Tax=freshwater metagenome TaxID=449393 RepID=A0A6J5ZDG3_9ZZZZ